MPTIEVDLKSVSDTDASLGWAGGHTVVIDRPEGRAGGLGLGFNGGQMLALAIGGCFCNDLHYVAHDMGVRIEALSVRVALDLDGQPMKVIAANVQADIKLSDEARREDLLSQARDISTVSNSVTAGFPVRFA